VNVSAPERRLNEVHEYGRWPMGQRNRLVWERATDSRARLPRCASVVHVLMPSWSATQTLILPLGER